MGRASLVLLAALLFASAAQATPIRPDLKKLVTAPPPSRESFVPARAGWNGPEMSPDAPNPVLQYLLRRPPVWQEVASIAVPDWRLVALLGLAILLLRTLRRREQKQEKKAEVLAFPRGGERKAA